jgi:hypothetical protein
LEGETDADLNCLLDRLKVLLHEEGECEEIPSFETFDIGKGMLGQVERIQIPKTPELQHLLRINAKFWNMANWLVRGRYFSRLKPSRFDITAQRKKLKNKFLEKAKEQSSFASPHPHSYFFSSQATIEAEVRETLEKKIEYYEKPLGKQNYGTDAKLLIIMKFGIY